MQRFRACSVQAPSQLRATSVMEDSCAFGWIEQGWHFWPRLVKGNALLRPNSGRVCQHRCLVRPNLPPSLASFGLDLFGCGWGD